MMNRYCILPLVFLFLLVQIFLLSGEYYFTAPAIPLAILAGIFIYRSPETGLLILAFFVPLEGLFSGNSLFTGTKLIGFTLLTVVFIKVLLRQIPLTNFKTPLIPPIILLLLLVFLSSMFSSNPDLSSQAMRQLLTVIAIFFLTLLIGHRIDLLNLSRTITASVTLTAAVSLFATNPSSEERAIGLLADPNFFALLLISAIPLAIYLVFHESMLVNRLIWGVFLIVMLIAFQKTMSRSGLMILLFSLFLIVIHYRYVFKKMTLSQLFLGFVATLVLIVLTIGALPDEYQERIRSLSSISSGLRAFDDRSLSRRSSYIVVAFDVFRANPILGSGPGTFPVKYALSGYAVAYSSDNENLEIYRRAHNTYLETLAETGLPGLILLVTIILLGVQQFQKARKNEFMRGRKKEGDLISHYAISLLSIALFFLFLSALTNKFFWIFLALGCSLSRKATPDKRDTCLSVKS